MWLIYICWSFFQWFIAQADKFWDNDLPGIDLVYKLNMRTVCDRYPHPTTDESMQYIHKT